MFMKKEKSLRNSSMTSYISIYRTAAYFYKGGEILQKDFYNKNTLKILETFTCECFKLDERLITCVISII